MEHTVYLPIISKISTILLTWGGKKILAAMLTNISARIVLFKIRRNAYFRLLSYCVVGALVFYSTDPLQGIFESQTGIVLNTDAFSTALLVIVVLAFSDLIQFSRFGIEYVEPSVKSGTNYASALGLCANELWFLGTGASKLTLIPEFEEAMKRCNGAKASIRFLLSRPTNEVLSKAERVADHAQDSYSLKVKASLAQLKHLKEQRRFDFEVRFYPSDKESDLQHFRMMFINGSTLLLSYNIYGNGDGSDAPQLVINKSGIDLQKRSFYYPFRQYFETLWDNSQPWDFKDFA
jgi:hypothetical protein